MIKLPNGPSCNRCANTDCPYTYKAKDMTTGKVRIRRGKRRAEHILCKLRKLPRSGFQLAELALAHPQSLHDALSALPFKVDLNFHLNRR